MEKEHIGGFTVILRFFTVELSVVRFARSNITNKNDLNLFFIIDIFQFLPMEGFISVMEN